MMQNDSLFIIETSFHLEFQRNYDILLKLWTQEEQIWLPCNPETHVHR